MHTAFSATGAVPDRLPFFRWQRTATERRLLAIEHPNGSLEEKGFVRVLTLIADDGGQNVSALEWQDPEDGPRMRVLGEDDFELGLLSQSLVCASARGANQVWHFDECALAKIRRAS